jgi:hypothetical protein
MVPRPSQRFAALAVPRRSRRSTSRPVVIEGLVKGDDVNREFFELMSSAAPRRSAVGRAVVGLVGARALADARPHLEVLLQAAQARTLRDHPADAARALVLLGRLLCRTADRAVGEQIICAGRQLAAAEAVEALLDACLLQGADLPALALGLRFAGPEAVDLLVARLNAAQDLSTRRAYYDFALALAALPEMKRALAEKLEHALGDGRWFVVRNALVLLAALKIAVPRERQWALAASPHRQVRLAVAQIASRQPPTPDSLDVLTELLSDADAGVRFAAAVGLGRHTHPRADGLLRRAAGVEEDAETRGAIEAALARRRLAS